MSDGPAVTQVDLPGARVAFSTRLGGVSEPPYDSLNLGILTGDDRDRVRENRRRLAERLELSPDRVAQVDDSPGEVSRTDWTEQGEINAQRQYRTGLAARCRLRRGSRRTRQV